MLAHPFLVSCEDCDPVIDYLESCGLLSFTHSYERDQDVLHILLTENGRHELRQLRNRNRYLLSISVFGSARIVSTLGITAFSLISLFRAPDIVGSVVLVLLFLLSLFFLMRIHPLVNSTYDPDWPKSSRFRHALRWICIIAAMLLLPCVPSLLVLLLSFFA